MTSILFPISDSPMGARPKQGYVPFMSDIARASSDAADALVLFKNLVEGTANSPDSVGFMAFDAHGGDTGCHLRAGMVLETFMVYKYFQSEMPFVWGVVGSWFDETVAKLRNVHMEAESACRKLLKVEVQPGKLGLPSVENSLKILGWDHAAEPSSLIHVLRQSLYETNDDILERIPPLLSHHLRRTRALTSNGQLWFESPSSESASVYSGFEASTGCSEATTPGSCSEKSELWYRRLDLGPAADVSNTEEETPLATEWDPLNFYTLSRFLVFCYVLSKYKTFAVLNGTIRTRLMPEDVAELSYRFIRPHVAKETAPGKPQRILRELSGLQAWLSDLSCAWQRSLATRSVQVPNLQRLVVSTVQQSYKGLKAVACYPGYLLAREAWASMNHTLLLIDRHFCTDGGFHYNAFEATLSSPLPACSCHQHPLGLHVSWRVERVSWQDVAASADFQPHVVIMGNSISGGHAEYMDHFAAKTGPHLCSSGSPCADNEKHVGSFLAADHDRLALSFFALHSAYAFPLSSAKEGSSGGGDDRCDADAATACEIAFVEDRIDTWAEITGLQDGDAAAAKARTLKRSWRTSREEADAMGTGPGSMETFAWQHAFVETKARVARRIQEWIKTGELMPLHAEQ